jgi:uncharacterized Fe-S center protein
MRTHGRTNLPDKLRNLIRAAGFDDLDLANQYVAIKMHLGEPGGLAYLRPNYARVIVDEVKAQGGRPFITDCNTLYVGGRSNALDHLDSAYANGFNPFQTGCHTIIADGLKGLDEVEVPVVGGEYVREAKIGRALMDADVLISLTHFKGHEQAGFGGALKNIGMGGGSRAGKMEQHAAGKPSVDADRCIGCQQCAKICAHSAISFDGRGGEAPNGRERAFIDHDRCVGCGRCIAMCNQHAISPDYDAAADVLNCKIAEYAKAVCDGRQCFHVALAIDVSPNCDCHDENDTPIVPDIGMFASLDPVALDQACADAVNAAPTMPHTDLADAEADEDLAEDPLRSDHFHMVHPDTDWRTCVEHAEKIGMGTRRYELVRV